jgi:hypothetical protein
LLKIRQASRKRQSGRKGRSLMGEAKRPKNLSIEFGVRRALENGRRLERAYLEIFKAHPEYSMAKMRRVLEAWAGVPISDDVFDVIEGNRRRGTLGGKGQ